MLIDFLVNGSSYTFDVLPGETLFNTLRKAGFHSIKFGDELGFSGADTVLLDGKPVNSYLILTAQIAGHKIVTAESLGSFPEQGWKKSIGLHPLQMAFIQTGAIQCGYCTPALLLASKALLDVDPDPTEAEVREAISGVLCRCTGYEKPVEAVLLASAVLRNANLERKPNNYFIPFNLNSNNKVVGKSPAKVDAFKLAQGKPVFTADYEIKNLLHAKILTSPHAHAQILSIDFKDAISLPGVRTILTWKDLPRVIYSTAGQSDPIPGPLDTFSLDKKVRFVGDRVAFIAAETKEIADKAASLIKVDYEVMPALLDPQDSQKENAPLLHDETEYVNFGGSNPRKNLAAEIKIDIGDVEKGFTEADRIIEETYSVPKVQQVHIEPHVALSYWDEDDRLVIRSSTQVPFHARRVLSKLLDIPIKRIRIIKPRIGGGFGGKQEVLIEDVVAHLTIATGRPVLLEYSRMEEFTSSRSRHPMKIKMKTGVKNDGTITANEMIVLSDTGAYGCHALTVTGNTGHKAMGLYVGDGIYRQHPNIRFHADVVYTNTPPAGAYRGYGVPQGFWPVERHMEKIANALNLDPIAFRLKNAIRPGEFHPFSTAWNEGREPRPEIIHTVGLPQCVEEGKIIIGWNDKFGNPEWNNSGAYPSLRKGIGIALAMQGTAIPYLDMGAASLKMNDDGSFNLLVGATDLGTGSDTVLAQMAAEVLGVALEDIIVYSSDTDFTPFDKGAYASSTTYVSGAAVVKAANQVAEQIKNRAAKLLQCPPEEISLTNGHAFQSNGQSVSFAEVALSSLHHFEQEQIMGVASFVAQASPPPFSAQFAEVTVDVETGLVTVDQLVLAVDSGRIINLNNSFGQLEGGMTQALGYALCEEMTYDPNGKPNETDLARYHIFRSNEMPELKSIFVETDEPSHPFGVKAVAEIPMDGVAPAIGNAIRNAIGVEIDTLPITPEKVWRALRNKK